MRFVWLVTLTNFLIAVSCAKSESLAPESKGQNLAASTPDSTSTRAPQIPSGVISNGDEEEADAVAAVGTVKGGQITNPYPDDLGSVSSQSVSRPVAATQTQAPGSSIAATNASSSSNDRTTSNTTQVAQSSTEAKSCNWNGATASHGKPVGSLWYATGYCVATKMTCKNGRVMGEDTLDYTDRAALFKEGSCAVESATQVNPQPQPQPQPVPVVPQPVVPQVQQQSQADLKALPSNITASLPGFSMDDLNNYCKKIGYSTALVKVGASDWICTGGAGTVTIDFDHACSLNFKGGSTTDPFVRTYNQNSRGSQGWVCELGINLEGNMCHPGQLYNEGNSGYGWKCRDNVFTQSLDQMCANQYPGKNLKPAIKTSVPGAPGDWVCVNR